MNSSRIITGRKLKPVWGRPSKYLRKKPMRRLWKTTTETIAPRWISCWWKTSRRNSLKGKWTIAATSANWSKAYCPTSSARKTGMATWSRKLSRKTSSPAQEASPIVWKRIGDWTMYGMTWWRHASNDWTVWAGKRVSDIGNKLKANVSSARKCLWNINVDSARNALTTGTTPWMPSS